MEGDIVPRIRQPKADPGQDIWLCGGGDIAAQLIDEIDEVQIKLNPVLFGSGIRLAALDYAPREFSLTSSVSLPGGVVLLTYRRP